MDWQTFQTGCCSLDLETNENGEIFAIGAVFNDKTFQRKAPFNVRKTLAEFDDFAGDYDDDLENINMSNVISLDEVLERRTSVRLNRERIITLDDLIKQLEFYEKIDQRLALQNKNSRAMRRAKSYEKFTAEDIINMAHDEYIETSIKVLQSVLERIFLTGDKVGLSELKETGMDKVSIYIALLFLSARSNIDLVQDEFYSELYIVPGDYEQMLIVDNQAEAV